MRKSLNGWTAIALIAFLNAAPTTAAGAQSLADNVVVVENLESPVSVTVAQDYAKKRSVRNLVTVRCIDSALNAGNETIPFADYQSQIETPLRGFLSAHPKVRFIVLT